MDINQIFKEFNNKNILLLQGPIGIFFYKLSKILKNNNANIFKLNFNGGDAIFYPFKADKFNNKLLYFKGFFKKYCLENNIDFIIAYNDCRPLHRIAIKMAKRLKINIYIFEEGYLRPNFITLEKDGVNANSKLYKNKNIYSHINTINKIDSINAKQIKGSFKYMAFFAFLYWLFAFLLAPFYNNNLHHRSLSIFEFLPWIRAFYRKFYYQIKEKKIKKTIQTLNGKYFIAPLQVFNDTQILKHYNGGSIIYFIEQILKSFAKYSRPNHYLIFKHHPMDIGYVNYEKLIKTICRQKGLENRVFYIHDIHLPSVLKNALGCVVINSTVGYSALYHNCPLKVCGKAFYDINGLCYQKSLNTFWKEAHSNKPDYQFFLKFQNYLIKNNQINTNFYKNPLN